MKELERSTPDDRSKWRARRRSRSSCGNLLAIGALRMRLCATMEAEGVDAEVLTIMQPDDFGELGINASLARQLQEAALRPAAVRPPPPPPQRRTVPPAPRKERLR